jgi:hypothetical protein
MSIQSLLLKANLESNKDFFVETFQITTISDFSNLTPSDWTLVLCHVKTVRGLRLLKILVCIVAVGPENIFMVSSKLYLWFEKLNSSLQQNLLLRLSL